MRPSHQIKTTPLDVIMHINRKPIQVYYVINMLHNSHDQIDPWPTLSVIINAAICIYTVSQ